MKASITSKKLRFFFVRSFSDEKISAIQLEKLVNELNHTPTQEACLKLAYEFITHRYEGSRIKTFGRLFDLLSSSADELWGRKGFMHCTNQNYLLSSLLVRSRHFAEDDIKFRWTTIWLLSPHQYLLVTVGRTTVAVDTWARHYGVAFGEYATRFNTTIFKRFAE